MTIKKNLICLILLTHSLSTTPLEMLKSLFGDYQQKGKKMESYSLLQMKLMMILKTYHLKESLEKLLVERIILLMYYLKKKSGT